MNQPVPKQGIASIRPHMTSLPEGFGADTIKLASNESSFGPSPNVIEICRQSLAAINRYAEQGTAALQKAIGHVWNLDPLRIICGPGSDELLARLCRAYLRPEDELLYSATGYAKFGNYALANDASPIRVADKNFVVNIDNMIAAITPKTRIVTIANPDNPTGTFVTGSEIRRLHSALPSSVILVLDSAYAEYVDHGDYEQAAALVEENENVVMTRTFSKIYGLAGLRLGWLYGSDSIVESLNRIGTTFPISNIALDAGIAAVKDSDHVQEVFQRNQSLRNQLYENMDSLGLHPLSSQTNFMLVRFPESAPTAKLAAETLWHNNIMIRQFPGAAYENSLRISIGNEQEMEIFTKVLSEFLSEQKSKTI